MAVCYGDVGAAVDVPSICWHLVQDPRHRETEFRTSILSLRSTALNRVQIDVIECNI